jgi:hypothetical protein
MVVLVNATFEQMIETIARGIIALMADVLVRFQGPNELSESNPVCENHMSFQIHGAISVR